MENKRKKIILLIFLVIIFLAVFVVFAFILTGKINFFRKQKDQKNYLNIDKNKVIENPTKEDIKNLIDTIQNNGEL
ncbi:MAG: hypothetical protein PHH83_02275 [Patescibacteria group bacterium]|nr:hypothetical protein [Patescibacteria group bacterium]